MHSGTVPETFRNTNVDNQGTNEDDSMSDPYHEAGLFRSQNTQNSGREIDPCSNPPRWKIFSSTFSKVAFIVTWYSYFFEREYVYKILDFLKKIDAILHILQIFFLQNNVF